LREKDRDRRAPCPFYINLHFDRKNRPLAYLGTGWKACATKALSLKCKNQFAYEKGFFVLRLTVGSAHPTEILEIQMQLIPEKKGIMPDAMLVTDTIALNPL
jgi:hypothetical protein